MLFGMRNILSSILHINQRKMGACLINLDFYKAYDHVLVSFLLKVMQKMGFGTLFCEWIKLLTKVSKAIRVSFSICQGDPLAMLLYIIYVEPLLIPNESQVIGLQVISSIANATKFS